MSENKKEIEVDISDEDFLTLAKEAHKKGVSFNDFVVDIIKDYIDRETANQKDEGTLFGRIRTNMASIYDKNLEPSKTVGSSAYLYINGAMICNFLVARSLKATYKSLYKSMFDVRKIFDEEFNGRDDIVASVVVVFDLDDKSENNTTFISGSPTTFICAIENLKDKLMKKYMECITNTKNDQEREELKQLLNEIVDEPLETEYPSGMQPYDCFSVPEKDQDYDEVRDVFDETINMIETDPEILENDVVDAVKQLCGEVSLHTLRRFANAHHDWFTQYYGERKLGDLIQEGFNKAEGDIK